MDAFIQFLIDFGYWGMLMAAFLAGSFFPFSSEAVMVGLQAAGLDPWGLVVYGTIGNVVGGMFNLSRTEAARQISAGNVSINYQESLKTDFAVKDGDIVSLRGAGKGCVTGTGGTSRKGRLFVYAEIYK